MLKKYPVKIRFYKTQEMIYFSQLDLVCILERALRRTKLPLYYTSGFRPHVKISFGKAVKLGIEGEEEVTIYFSQPIDIETILIALKKQLPFGLEIRQICKI